MMKKITNILLSVLLVLSVMPLSAKDVCALSNYLTFTAEEANSTITFSWVTGNDVEISTDRVNFSSYTKKTKITLANAGDKVYFRGSNVVTDTSNKFVMTGKIAASGDVTSLINQQGGAVSLEGLDGCFRSMFENCKSLTSAPNLPSLVLSAHCYHDMFKGCTSLEEAPSLPAVNLKDTCYRSMFYGCTSLKEAPELPATTLSANCYFDMFHGCTSLTKAPTLPATILAESCYQGMFEACTSLITAPELPAKNLGNSCYRDMFSGCTALKKAPELPALTMGASSYRGMFYNCSSLENIPNLPATTLATECYMDMFYNCKSLELTYNKNDAYEYKTWSIPEGVQEQKNWNKGMFYNCSNVKLNASDSVTPVIGVEYYTEGYVKGNFLTFTAEEENSSVSFSWVSGNVEISTDKRTFKEYTKGSIIELENIGDRIYFRGTDVVTDTNNHFTMSGKISCEGDVTSLLDGVGGDVSLEGHESCFRSMFENCIGLTKAPKLPSNDLSQNCYYEMFKGCTSLTAAPELPATTMKDSCYRSMFYGCTGLKEAPELPATTLSVNCYFEMFKGCTSLTAAPDLPATELKASCYQGMFNDCTSLKKTPNLPATTIAQSCYRDMFFGCTNLISAPELPATTLESDCYRAMFYNCTSLKSVPNLPATTLGISCYRDMFYGCTNICLNYQKDSDYENTSWSIPKNAQEANSWNKDMFSGCSNVSFDKNGSKEPVLGVSYYLMGELKLNSIEQEQQQEEIKQENKKTEGVSGGQINLEGVVAPIINLLNSFLKPLMMIVGAAGSLYCVVLGIKYARADEPQDREKAKQHLKGAVIGFVLIFLLIVLLNQFIGPLTEWAGQYDSTLK